MKPEDYKKAANFFNALRVAARKTSEATVEEIGRIVEEYKNGCGLPDHPTYAVDVLEAALDGLKRYNKNDLEHLADAGFNINNGVIHCRDTIDIYLECARELKQYLSKVDISTKEFIERDSNRDHLKMFTRFLTAYAEIAEYEEKLENPEEQKKLALKEVLSGKNR